MMEKNDILDSSRMKDNPFIVPEGYFREMPVRASLVKGRRKGSLVVPLVSVAAALAIVIAGVWTWSEKRNFASNPVESAVQMSDEEIIAYLIYSGVEVEEIEIHEVEH